MLDPKQRQRFLGDNRARIGIGIVIVMALAAILAPLIARQKSIWRTSFSGRLRSTGWGRTFRGVTSGRDSCTAHASR